LTVTNREVIEDKMLEMQISGGDEIASMLDDLGTAEKREFKKTAKKEVRAALRPIHAVAKATAPRVTGRLRRAIKLRAWRRPARGEVGVKVSIDPGRKRNDPNGAYYGLMVEGGFVANGVYVPGRHMLEIAYRRGNQLAQLRVAMALSREADGIINRHRRRTRAGYRIIKGG